MNFEKLPLTLRREYNSTKESARLKSTEAIVALIPEDRNLSMESVQTVIDSMNTFNEKMAAFDPDQRSIAMYCLQSGNGTHAKLYKSYKRAVELFERNLGRKVTSEHADLLWEMSVESVGEGRIVTLWGNSQMKWNNTTLCIPVGTEMSEPSWLPFNNIIEHSFGRCRYEQWWKQVQSDLSKITPAEKAEFERLLEGVHVGFNLAETVSEWERFETEYWKAFKVWEKKFKEEYTEKYAAEKKAKRAARKAKKNQ